MAAKPQMTVRLAPSIVHALEYLAEREGISPAELARVQITAACQSSLDRHGWRADCQSAYMDWLSRRVYQAGHVGQVPAEVTDIAVDGEPEPATPARPVESGAPHGATDDRSALGGGWTPPPNRRNPRYDDQLVDTLHLREDGRKKSRS